MRANILLDKETLWNKQLPSKAGIEKWKKQLYESGFKVAKKKKDWQRKFNDNTKKLMDQRKTSLDKEEIKQPNIHN